MRRMKQIRRRLTLAFQAARHDTHASDETFRMEHVDGLHAARHDTHASDETIDVGERDRYLPRGMTRMRRMKLFLSPSHQVMNAARHDTHASDETKSFMKGTSPPCREA